MRLPLVRLIAGKELRDLLRDRRTVLLTLGLPAVLYPLFGLAAMVFAVSLLSNPPVVGVANADALAGVAVPLLDGTGFAAGPADGADDAVAGVVVVEPVTGDPAEALRTKAVDVVLVLPPTLAADLAAGRRPTLTVLDRDGDDKSKLAGKRLAAAVRAWEGKLRAQRFAARGLPPDFDQVFTVVDPQTDKPKEKKAADELRDAVARVLPFILMMWLVAGAIHPAVDMTAGEKERGTMETLLISPADRAEIVAGKFLATTAFAFVTVVWNVLFLTAALLAVQTLLGFPVVNLPGLAGCVVLALPQAMLFSAVCLALGVFAKSTKEGQYYLVPLVLVAMPLAFWAMLPTTGLTPLTFWVPVAGPMLLQAKFLAVGPDPVPWEYVGPVLLASAGWVAAALALAVWQFKREAVLFREAGPAAGANPLRKLFGRRAGAKA